MGIVWVFEQYNEETILHDFLEILENREVMFHRYIFEKVFEKSLNLEINSSQESREYCLELLVLHTNTLFRVKRWLTVTPSVTYTHTTSHIHSLDISMQSQYHSASFVHHSRTVEDIIRPCLPSHLRLLRIEYCLDYLFWFVSA